MTMAYDLDHLPIRIPARKPIKYLVGLCLALVMPCLGVIGSLNLFLISMKVHPLYSNFFLISAIVFVPLIVLIAVVVLRYISFRNRDFIEIDSELFVINAGNTKRVYRWKDLYKFSKTSVGYGNAVADAFSISRLGEIGGSAPILNNYAVETDDLVSLVQSGMKRWGSAGGCQAELQSQ
jgi:hypothetical protein